MRRHHALLIAVAALASLALVPQAGAAGRACNPAAQVPLDLAAAAATPMFGTTSSARLSKVNKAVEDRLEKKIPEGCEEWSFTMSLTSVLEDGSTWSMRWAAGRFRVSRAKGMLDGSQLAGYGAGWPGIIGNSKGSCREETDAGRINHGPVTFTGGPFHYAIAGTVTDSGFSLELSSDDAKTSITGPPDEVCQALAGLARLIVDSFVKGPFPLDFEVAPGQTTVTYDESGDGTTFKATITRVKG